MSPRTGTPSGSYCAMSSSGDARSALVRQSSGWMPASYPATRMRSIIPVRGGGSASAVTMTSWSALATIGRSYGSSSSAVRRSTVSRSSTCDDARQRALLARRVTNDPNSIADDDACPAELPRLGSGHVPIRDQDTVTTAIDSDHHADLGIGCNPGRSLVRGLLRRPGRSNASYSSTSRPPQVTAGSPRLPTPARSR